jgi:hypothetical protein
MSPKSAPIFSENLLSHYLGEFRLSNVTGIRDIKLQIDGFIEELNSGKIDNAKEEEIKQRFILIFFGDVLGFNYGNSTKYLLKLEKKSNTDGTRADAALGYFQVSGDVDDVRAVIEVKGPNCNLDKKQNGTAYNNQTPVEQAFAYAPKAGGKCKWVIVSNIIETRIYLSTDASKYQSFHFGDLIKEEKLKELFFLFHKDRFIKKNEKASTDLLLERVSKLLPKDEKPLHIIDQLYKSLKRFEGLGFVDPNYLASLKPFNILDEYVWYYNANNLFTINSEIYYLLSNLTLQDSSVEISEILKDDINKNNVIEAKEKLNWAFTFLNHCHVHEISAIKNYNEIQLRNKNTIGFSIQHAFHFRNDKDGITKNINLLKSKECDCLLCNYRSLNFRTLLNKLKSSEGNNDLNNLEYAYGNYLAASNNFKATYNVLKSIERDSKGHDEKCITYFLSKMNLKLLHNLVFDYSHDDKEAILKEIKSVDLDKVIYDDIEFYVDNDVKKYLIDIKEDVLIYKVQDEIDEIVSEIEKVKLLYEKGGNRNGPNLPSKLWHEYTKLHSHINRNFIIYDTFIRYKELAKKMFKGLVLCSFIPDYDIVFNDFILTEAIIHIQQSELQEILKDIKSLNSNDKSIDILLEKLNNFLTSTYDDGFFNEPIENAIMSSQLNNHRFRDRYTSIFANLFTVLSRLEISKNNFEKCKNSLIKFLKVDNNLAWFDLKELSLFIEEKGFLFEIDDLVEILQLSIKSHKYGFNKYTKLLSKTSAALNKYYPEYRIENKQLVNRSIINSVADLGTRADYLHLCEFYNISNDECKNLFERAFEEELDRNFSATFYECLLRKCQFDYKKGNFFKQYINYVNTRRNGAYKFGKNEYTDLVFINFIFRVYQLKIQLSSDEISSLKELNDFENWLINPSEFDYIKFKATWLIDLHDTFLIKEISFNRAIFESIEDELLDKFNPILAEIKYLKTAKELID